jgi:hypothetical protein
MMIGSKGNLSVAAFLVVASFLFVTSSVAADFTYNEYSKASEIWKRGFVSGISHYMSTVAQPDEEAPYPVRNAYQRCLSRSTDVLLVSRVDAYVAKNSASLKQPMVVVVMRTLFDLCRSEIENAQQPKATRHRR